MGRYNVAIDLFIVWFACASIVAFNATKGQKADKQTCNTEECYQIEEEEK